MGVQCLGFVGVNSTQCDSLLTTKSLMNGTISTPGGNSWLWTLRISNIVAQWSNMITCESSYYWYLKKSSIIWDVHHWRQLMDVYQNLKGNSWPEEGRKFFQWPPGKTSGNFGYEPMRHTPALWKHTSHEIVFTLIMDDFGVKCKNRQDAEHLRNALQILYPMTTYWTGSENWDSPWIGNT